MASILEVCEVIRNLKVPLAFSPFRKKEGVEFTPSF